MTINRRNFATGMAAVAVIGSNKPVWAADTVKIGYVSPQTGVLASFGETDKWVIEQMKTAFKEGVFIAGKKHQIQIILKDSQSNKKRAEEVANELIKKDKVSLILTAGTPETANPVSDVAEANQTPCISSVVPWQSWFYGRKGNFNKGFDWTYHIFFGLEDVMLAYMNGWRGISTNKKVGVLFPNDEDGKSWADKDSGFPKTLSQMGFSLTDPGRFESGTQDFSRQISLFQQEGVEIVTGVIIPADAKAFLTQAREKGYKPKIITIAKALMHPLTIESLGDLGEGLTSDVWWSPVHPFNSSITGQSSQALADAYESSTKKQWAQPLAFSHALFEVASDALKRSQSLNSNDLRDSVAATKLKTVVGVVSWGARGAFKNVSKTPLVFGQWSKGKKFKYDLNIVNNETAKIIPVTAKMVPA